MDFWATPEVVANLCGHLGCTYDQMLARLHIDTPFGVGGRYVGPTPPPGEDIWGLRHTTVSHGAGAYDEVTNAPLALYESVADIEADYHWPSPDDWDYSHLREQIRSQDHRPIRGGGSEPFLLYKSLRGDAQAYIDLVENPEVVDYCLDRLFALAYQDTLRIFEAIPGKVLLTYVAEDLGMQRSLLISRQHIHRFLLPRMKQIMDLTHQAGAYVFHHDDGAIREILPDLLDAGIDLLNPIQWRLPGMAREDLKADFGDRVIFHGAIDNQSTLPFGSVEDVRREVTDNFCILGAGGGYILAPCHNIQDVTPPENIVAMYRVGYEESWKEH